jgi:hypothetical protein
MPTNKYQQYRDTAFMLWIVGALLFGLAAASFFEADRRQTLFFIVFMVGVVAVVRLNRRPGKAPAPSEHTAAVPRDSVEELLAGGTLSADAGRQWLDRLLVKQQEEEKK